MHNSDVARPKRRKTASARKEELIPVRLTKEQKVTLTAAAGRRGIGVSTWLLVLALAEAAKDEAADKAPPKT
jgi:uncharacterized protein (DUF1778 family)